MSKATPIMFRGGKIVMTKGVFNAVNGDQEEVQTCLRRHLLNDWGDLDAEDIKANDVAVKVGGRILSAYHLKDGTKIWIITEWDRSVTTILLPEEY
jgi:hypothetical protein